MYNLYLKIRKENGFLYFIPTVVSHSKGFFFFWKVEYDNGAKKEIQRDSENLRVVKVCQTKIIFRILQEKFFFFFWFQIPNQQQKQISCPTCTFTNPIDNEQPLHEFIPKSQNSKTQKTGLSSKNLDFSFFLTNFFSFVEFF